MTTKKPGRNRLLSENKDAVVRDLFAQGRYDVSRAGEVTNLVTHRVLKPFVLNKTGFLVVTLISQFGNYKCLVHRLVALRYLPAPPRYMEVDHLNGVKTDNRLDNLCWATREENVRRDFEGGRCNIGASGDRHNNAILTDREAFAVVRIAATNKLSPVEIAECFDVAAFTDHAISRARIRKGL